MLSPEEMLTDWMRVAEARGLEALALPDDEGTLRTLTMKGSISTVGLSVTYGPVDESTSPTSLRADGSVRGPFALEVQGAVKSARESALRVRQDPTPTLRKVASWVGRGDPEVGDKEFDDVFLIEADASVARALLVPDARDALKELARLGVPLDLTVEGSLATLRCDRIEKAEPALDAAVRAVVAVCG